ncbi:MAG: hypothetical protein KTR31_12545 [Myxococcales bacterium]|nr:hypothetical protein [Myxococcales bacterium]
MAWLLILTATALAFPELCNGVDDDGDGQIDEGPVVWGVDGDGDGYGSRSELILAPDCSERPAGVQADVLDCEGDDGDVSPDAGEVCNLRDDDCDGVVDAFGNCVDRGVGAGSVLALVGPPGPWDGGVAVCAGRGGAPASIDSAALQVLAASLTIGANAWVGGSDLVEEGTFVWEDGTPFVYTHWDDDPPQPDDWQKVGGEDCMNLEHEDAKWNDAACDAVYAYLCERECDTQFFADDDGDGLGDPARAVVACMAPDGHVANDADCDDATAALPAVLYADTDADGWGDSAVRVVGCAVPGHVQTPGDCDDDADSVYPGARDVAGDGVDSDCDGQDLPAVVDSDGDGLPDNIEIELGSDPNNPDTDGDGVLDGAETLEGLLDPGGDGRLDPPEVRVGFGLCATSSGSPPLGWVGFLALFVGLRGRRCDPRYRRLQGCSEL